MAHSKEINIIIGSSIAALLIITLVAYIVYKIRQTKKLREAQKKAQIQEAQARILNQAPVNPYKNVEKLNEDKQAEQIKKYYDAECESDKSPQPEGNDQTEESQKRSPQLQYKMNVGRYSAKKTFFQENFVKQPLGQTKAISHQAHQGTVKIEPKQDNCSVGSPIDPEMAIGLYVSGVSPPKISIAKKVDNFEGERCSSPHARKPSENCEVKEPVSDNVAKKADAKVKKSTFANYLKIFKKNEATKGSNLGTPSFNKPAPESLEQEA